MKETEKQIPSFKKKLGNTTYTVKVHFDENSTETLVDKVKSLSPAFGGRFEAVLDNGEKTIISRQYVSVLKERLGL